MEGLFGDDENYEDKEKGCDASYKIVFTIQSQPKQVNCENGPATDQIEGAPIGDSP